MDEAQFSQVITKLDSVLKLLSLNAVSGKTLKQQVELLSSVGFQPREIAEMLGKTPNHISVVLHEIRRGKREPSSEEVTQKRGSPEANTIG